MINVKDYGVKGDGTLDDVSLINSLFVSGGEIFSLPDKPTALHQPVLATGLN